MICTNCDIRPICEIYNVMLKYAPYADIDISSCNFNKKDIKNNNPLEQRPIYNPFNGPKKDFKTESLKAQHKDDIQISIIPEEETADVPKIIIPAFKNMVKETVIAKCWVCKTDTAHTCKLCGQPICKSCGVISLGTEDIYCEECWSKKE